MIPTAIVIGIFCLIILKAFTDLAKTRHTGDFEEDYYSEPRAQEHQPYLNGQAPVPPGYYQQGFYPPMFSMQQGPIFSPDGEFVWDEHKQKWVTYGKEGHASILAGIVLAIILAAIFGYFYYVQA